MEGSDHYEMPVDSIPSSDYLDSLDLNYSKLESLELEMDDTSGIEAPVASSHASHDSATLVNAEAPLDTYSHATAHSLSLYWKKVPPR